MASISLGFPLELAEMARRQMLNVGLASNWGLGFRNVPRSLNCEYLSILQSSGAIVEYVLSASEGIPLKEIAYNLGLGIWSHRT